MSSSAVTPFVSESGFATAADGRDLYVGSAEIEQVYLLVLACSGKTGGYCVAGHRVYPLAGGNWHSDGEWLRPVPDDGSLCGALSEQQIICSNGQRLKVGDVVLLQVYAGAGVLGQPENRVVVPGVWHFVQEVNSRMIAALAERPAHIWNDWAEPTNRVSTGIVQQGRVEESLLLIQPQNLVFELSYTTNQWDGTARKQTSAAFDYNGQHYSHIRVTCPLLGRVFRNQFPGLDEAPVQTRLRKGDGYVLCMSLTPEFRGKHYKLVASVFDHDGYLLDNWIRSARGV